MKYSVCHSPEAWSSSLKEQGRVCFGLLVPRIFFVKQRLIVQKIYIFTLNNNWLEFVLCAQMCVCVCLCVCWAGGEGLGQVGSQDKKVTGRHTCAVLFFSDF